jgi:flagellar basal-body rod protein FlgB
MNLVDTPLIDRLSRYLDVTAMRSKVIAGNIANVDTPGYQTRDVDFRSQLATLMNGGGENDGMQPLMPRVIDVPGLTERPDGNNVSIDREGLALGQVQLQFATGVALLKTELHRLSAAIHEGAQP